jgi:hypothetical protein
MNQSTFWKILAIVFGAIWVFDCFLMIMGRADTALLLANGAWTLISIMQMEKHQERERAAEAANREQTPNQG